MTDGMKKRDELAGRIRELLKTSPGELITLAMDRCTAEVLAEDLDIATFAMPDAEYTRADLRAQPDMIIIDEAADIPPNFWTGQGPGRLQYEDNQAVEDRNA